MLKAEIFETVTDLIRLGHHLWRPGAEVLDATNFDAWIVYIDPVVIKHASIFQDQHHGEEIAVFEALSCVLCPFTHAGRQTTRELPHRRGRNDVFCFDYLQITLSIFVCDRPIARRFIIRTASYSTAHLQPAT